MKNINNEHRIIHPRANYVGEFPNNHYNAIRQNAIKRNHEFTVSQQYLWDLFLAQNRKCILSGIELVFTQDSNPSLNRKDTTASVDRIDSKEGYIEGNVRWIHKDLNRMRNNHTDEMFLEWCRRCFLFSYKLDFRPSWDEYFLGLAFDVSWRSEDLHIKHGAIIIDNKTKHIIGTGYNATITGSDKTIINLSDRENRRPYMIHAEENAILNSSLNPLNLSEKASIYITGIPCIHCLQLIINFGINKIYYADRCGSITEDEKTIEIRKNLLSMSKIKYSKIKLENPFLKRVFYSP